MDRGYSDGAGVRAWTYSCPNGKWMTDVRNNCENFRKIVIEIPMREHIDEKL